MQLVERIIRIFIGITGPLAMVVFPSNVVGPSLVVRVEELIYKALLDREVTDLGSGRLQSFLDLRMTFHFEIGDDEVAGEDGECAHDERLVGGAMLEGVVGVDGVPDDDDQEGAGVSGNESGVDGLDAVGTIRISKDRSEWCTR